MIPAPSREISGTTIDIYLIGAWLGLRALLLALIEQGGGSIVLEGAVVVDIGMAVATIYSANQGGILSIARTATRGESSPRMIRAISVRGKDSRRRGQDSNPHTLSQVRPLSRRLRYHSAHLSMVQEHKIIPSLPR